MLQAIIEVLILSHNETVSTAELAVQFNVTKDIIRKLMSAHLAANKNTKIIRSSSGYMFQATRPVLVQARQPTQFKEYKFPKGMGDRCKELYDTERPFVIPLFNSNIKY